MKTPAATVLGLLFSLLLHFQGEVVGAKCHTRQESMAIMRLNAMMMCQKPQEKLVSVPIPEGYIKVVPAMVMAKKCEGLMCSRPNSVCGSKPGTTKTKTVKVQAMDGNMMSSCMEVHIKEDTKCACSCQAITCPINKVQDERSCQCRCNIGARKSCKGAFNRETCECVPQ